MLKLGVIDVLNVLPVFYGISSHKIKVDCELVFDKVTQLNQKLNRGEIDCSVISSFEYALNPDIYFILPDLSISADGPVKSIYLFLKKPLEDLRNDTIVLTEFSLTSVHLIQFLLKDFLIDFTQDKTIGATGELLIADEAIKRFYDNKDPYIYDLSELWKVKTGLPFVFALWVIRRDSFYKNRKAALKLYHSILHSKGISSEFIPEMAKEKNNGIFPEDKLCEDYLKNLHYEFSKPYQRGFNLFQDKMLQLHKLQKKAPLNFLPLD